MIVRRTIATAVAAVAFSIGASAAPAVHTVPAKAQSGIMLVHHHTHHMHHGHWRHGHHHHHWRHSAFCLFSLTPWCWH